MKKIKNSKLIVVSVTIIIAIIIVISGLAFLNKPANNDVGSIENVEDLNSLKELEGFVYVGRPTCPYCAVFYPQLEQVVDEENVTLNYLNTDNFKEEPNLTDTLEQYNVVYVPSLLKVKNGEVIKSFEYESLEDEQGIRNELAIFLNK